MNDTMEQLLIEALDLMEQGFGVDEIAGRYPEQAAELRPFLLTAFALSNLATQPTVTAEQKSKRALLATADGAVAKGPGRSVMAGSWLRRLLAPALALLAVLFLAGAGLVGASSFAAPGDALYETKRFIEETRLNLTANPERAAELREGFRQERIREIERLLAGGRQVDVSLTGVIESMTPNLWTVAGVPVAISAATEIDGEPVVGALVQVDGRTADGVVVAERVIVRAGGPQPIDDRSEQFPPAPTPERVAPAAETPVVPPTSDAGAQPPSLPITTASSTATATPSSTPTASVSSTPVASPTSESPPTATPDDDDDNGNDNDDDNNNDNDDNGNVNDNDDNSNDNDDDNANDDNGNVNDNDGNGNNNDDDNANDNDDNDDGNGNDNGGGDDD